jgi:hypothetical protein
MRVLHEIGSGGWEQGPRGPAEQVQKGVMLSLEAAPLGVGEARRRQLEGRQVPKHLAHAGETFLEPRGQGSER